MKRLVTIGVMGLALSFSSLSFASEFMNLYTKPVGKGEIRDEIMGEQADKDLMSLYITW
ncbi:MAG TPA: hypothetical protein VHT73_10080 [Thermodesulfobacteriota bacterium]|nr:hypothetical protein [Thermodesulfobacteriota bacterium]